MSMSAATTFSAAYTSKGHLFKMHPVIPCRSFQVVQAALSLLYLSTVHVRVQPAFALLNPF